MFYVFTNIFLFVFFQYYSIYLLQDKTTTSTFEIECLDDQSYKEVPEWPQCVDRLDCPPPEFDDLIMNSTWTDGDSLTPPFTVE